MTAAVFELPIPQLATTLAPLRGPRTDRTSALAPLPLRVAATPAGSYEVIDGFKRLHEWIAAGATAVPVVVEEAAGVVLKARLLEANAPRRTLSPMDEARVVRALADDDHLTLPQLGKLLGRGRGWVERRVLLGRRLAPEIAAHVDAGRLSATTATALARLPRGDQKRLAETVTRHGLRTREAEAMLAAWQATPDPTTREALLRDPRSVTAAPATAAASPLGASARELQARFDQTERALDELLHLDLSGFPEPDRRVLEACQRRLAAQVARLAHTQTTEVMDADSGGTARAPTTPARAHPTAGHRAPAGAGRQDDPPRGGPAGAPAPAVEAGALPGGDPRAGGPEPARAPDPARAPGARLHGRGDDLEDLSPDPAPVATADAAHGAPLRDAPGRGLW